MAELAVIATVASVAGTAMSAVGSVMAGREQSRAAAFEQQQSRIQEETNRTAAAQAEARRREELTANLETIQAIRAGRGVGSGSPTGMALLDSTTSEEEQNIRTERLNYLLKSDQARMAGQMAKSKAKTSLLAGYLGAGEEIASGIGKAYDISKGKGWFK